MVKLELPEEYRERHGLVATDSHGRHIGCSGAVKNTLVYYNPVSREHEMEELQRSQSREAKRKSVLSAKFRGTEVYAKRSKSMQEEKIHPPVLQRVHHDKPARSHSNDSYLMTVEPTTSNVVSEARHFTGKGLVREDQTIAVAPSDSATVVRAAQTMYNDEDTTKSPIQREEYQHSTLTDRSHIHDVLVTDAQVMQARLIVVESRPQSAETTDSYYLRIDEAFRKHREAQAELNSTEIGSSAESNGNQHCSEPKDVDQQSNTEPLNQEESDDSVSEHAAEDFPAEDINQSRTTRKSRFCAIL